MGDWIRNSELGLRAATVFAVVALVAPTAAADHDDPLGLVGDQIENVETDLGTVERVARSQVDAVEQDVCRFLDCEPVA